MATPTPSEEQGKKPFPFHLSTSLFTLKIITAFWASFYIIVVMALKTESLAWMGGANLPWYSIIIPILGIIQSMWFCWIDPCAPETTRLHYFWGKSHPEWESQAGQVSFWIAKLLNGMLASKYVNNIPGCDKKIPSKLYGKDVKGTDEDGALIEFAGGFKPDSKPPEPDSTKREEGKIKASMDWRVIDSIALMNQLINEFPTQAEIKWDGETQKKAEALFVSLHLFPEIRDVCLHTNYQMINKTQIQKDINDRVNGKMGDSEESVNDILCKIGIEIKVITVSEAVVTNPKTKEDLSAASREDVQLTREMQALASMKKQLDATTKMLGDSGFAANLPTQKRTAKIAEEALRVVKLNNNMQTTGGAALEELFASFKNKPQHEE